MCERENTGVEEREVIQVWEREREKQTEESVCEREDTGVEERGDTGVGERERQE